MEKGNDHVFHVIVFKNENVAFSVTTCTEPQYSMDQCMYVTLARTSDELKKISANKCVYLDLFSLMSFGFNCFNSLGSMTCC